MKNVIGTTLTARYMDKQFLTELTEEDWKAVIKELQASLTDAAIREAIMTFPPDIYKISGEHIVAKLISRRNDMMRYGLKYYRILNKEVDILGSNKRESVSINRMSGIKTAICLQKLNKKDEVSDTLYYRVFDHAVTKRIYVYGLDGDDVFTTTGVGKSKTRVTIIGGGGKDSFTATAKGRRKVNLYDEESNKVKTASIYRNHFTSDTSLTNYDRKRFQYDWYAPVILPGYNPDDGVSLGAGFTYKKKRWGKKPYAWMQSFGASVAFKTGGTHFYYNSRFVQAIGKWDFDLAASYKGPQYVFNYFGYGNDTKLTTDDKAYNRVRTRQLLVKPGVALATNDHEFRMGLVAEQIRVEDKPNKFVTSNEAALNKNVFEQNFYMGAGINYHAGKTNHRGFPRKGYGFNAGLTYKGNVTTGKSDFFNFASDVSFYLPIGKKLVLAHRIGMATNVGNFEFYHANTLSGSENLRGYNNTRFYGRTSFYQNTDLRIPIAKLKGYMFNGTLGIYGFFDDGRVWIENDKSGTMHVGYGGGVFFLPFSAAALNISYGHSNETNIAKLALEFFF